MNTLSSNWSDYHLIGNTFAFNSRYFYRQNISNPIGVWCRGSAWPVPPWCLELLQLKGQQLLP